MRNCEILAPAGNMEMLEAAVKSGAHAVYLGVENFNARRNAQNFKTDELPVVVSYCHKAGVRVYLTLNILISDTEFFEAVSLCFAAYNAGIDAVIIADTALAYYLHKNLPELPLHASTQMTVFSPAALLPLKDMGFKRVVAARELDRSCLKELCKKAKELDIEIEVFVHGALCMCVSGQCLLSAFLGGRSGNRGLCAGTCRLPFSQNGKEDYALSLKDLSLLKYLTELEEMGVASFKIEGRMKRPEYVAAAVSAARQALYDQKIDQKLESSLHAVFSRSGFTDGYYNNKPDASMFGVRNKEDVTAANDVFPFIHSLYRKQLSHTPVTAKLYVKSGEESRLVLSDEKHSVTAVGDIPEKALTKQLDLESAFNSISKLGDTPFYLENLDAEIDAGLMLKASSLNALRREAVEKLYEKRSVLPKPKKVILPKAKSPVKKEISGYILRVNDISLLPDDLTGVKAVLLPAERINSSIESISLPIVAELFRVYKDDSKVEEILKRISSYGIKYVSCANLSHIPLVQKAGLKVLLGFGLNCFSSYWQDFCVDIGACGLLLSPELTISAIKNTAPSLPTGIIAYGRLPLMVFKNCPIKSSIGCEACKKQGSLTDRKNITFPLLCREGFCELLNSVPLFLAECQNEISADYLVLYFTNETKEEIKEILDCYKSAKPSSKPYTRGLYYKGVM